MSRKASLCQATLVTHHWVKSLQCYHISCSSDAKNTALIDFAGPGCKVYLVTVSPNHTLSIDGLKHLFVASGHLKEGKDHTFQVSKNAKRIGKISYYWVVPESLAFH
jgi:hypothetical protein